MHYALTTKLDVWGGGRETSSGDDMPLFIPIYAVRLSCNSQWCGESRTAFLFFNPPSFTYVCFLCVWRCRIFLFPRSIISCHIPYIFLWVMFAFIVWWYVAFFPPLILSYPFHYFFYMWWCRIPPLISSQLGLLSCHICLISPFYLCLHLLYDGMPHPPLISSQLGLIYMFYLCLLLLYKGMPHFPSHIIAPAMFT